MPSALDGSKGKLIPLTERKRYCAWIDEAVANGARQQRACELVGINARTYQRWQQGGELQEDGRLNHTAPAHNRLSDAVRAEILAVINQPEYRDLTPHQIVPMLLDLGRYIASESTFYRVMRELKQLKHRRRSCSGSRKKPQSLQAQAPNQVYSWDITYLPTPVQGIYFYLYMVMDIFSRKIVGWQVYDTESSSYAADLIEDIARREQIDKQQLVIHSDNGSPMRGATLRARLETLGISPSYSRPRTSNDNPYSEALFKTVKYHYTYPDSPFETLSQARQWVTGFVEGYNNTHQHSALKFVTPEQRHTQQDKDILAQRKAVLEQAKARNPERWNGRKTRNLEATQVVYLNPQ